MVFTRQNITEKLSTGTDAHSGWYSSMNSINSSYAKANSSENGGNYTTGFYACLACHTNMGMSMNISRPQIFNINITTLSDMTINVSAPEVNFSVMNNTFSLKAAWTSIWT
jgi:hypothetical protein